jgi:hypothetical protein
MEDIAVPSDRLIVNQYLFLEFGLESNVEPLPVSEDWPFALVEAGTIDLASGSYTIYSFTHNGTPYWAFSSPTYLGCERKAGLSFEDLVLKERGGAWIKVYSGPRKLDHQLSYSGGPGKG